MKNQLTIFFCLCLLLACRNRSSEADQPAALEAQVLQVHDEAMANMDQLFMLHQQLTRLRDSLQTRQQDTATQSLLRHHIRLLQQADDAMMDWMHAYRAPGKDQDPASARQYLQQELHKIDQVKKQMDSTLAASQKVYQQHEPKK